jgi:hypothetical protein
LGEEFTQKGKYAVFEKNSCKKNQKLEKSNLSRKIYAKKTEQNISCQEKFVKASKI